MNEELLVHLGGSLYTPPLLPDQWMADPGIDEFVDRAQELVSSSFGTPRFVLKDPRMALLLPFWRRVLLDRCCAILIVRDPIEVAWSLALRDGISSLTSLALWSSYNRSAIEGLEGLPVHVCRYEELVETPQPVLSGIATSLRDWGELSQGDKVEEAAARIKPGYRRSSWPRGQGELIDLSIEVAALDKCLLNLRGRHDVFESEGLPERAIWEQPLLEERRAGGIRIHRANVERDAVRVEAAGLVDEIDVLRQRQTQLIGEAEASRRDAAELTLELRALCDQMESWRQLEGDEESLRVYEIQRELEMLKSNRTFRYTALLRRGYASIRRTVGFG